MYKYIFSAEICFNDSDISVQKQNIQVLFKNSPGKFSSKKVSPCSFRFQKLPLQDDSDFAASQRMRCVREGLISIQRTCSFIAL